MELFHYLEPYKHSSSCHEYLFGSHIISFDNIAGNLPDIRAGIVGIPFSNDTSASGTCLAPNLIRKYLYALSWNHPLKIADFGNIKQGKTTSDTWHAISYVVENMISNNIIPVIIGGDTENLLHVIKGMKNFAEGITVCEISPEIAITADEKNSSYFEKLILLNQPSLNEFSLLGYQNYYINQQHLEFFSKAGFNAVRLGYLRSKPFDAEPYMRMADVSSFKIGAVKHADAPGHHLMYPNGFQSDEICLLARQSGLGNKISVWALWDVNPEYDKSQQTIALAAQIIWHFLDAFASRIIEFPSDDITQFSKYHVSVDFDNIKITFYRSLRTDRWWVHIITGINNESYYIPCTYDDYQIIRNNEIPDRLLKYLQKFIKN